MQASSSTGRAAVSKTAGWGFDSLLACHKFARVIHIMVDKIEEKSPLDVWKWLLVVLLIGGGVVLNGHYASVDVAIRTAVGILFFCVILGVAITTTQGASFWAFAKSARSEMRKVVWPTRPETVQTTMYVVIMVVVTALVLWGVDSLFFWLVRWVSYSQ